MVYDYFFLIFYISIYLPLFSLFNSIYGIDGIDGIDGLYLELQHIKNVGTPINTVNMPIHINIILISSIVTIIFFGFYFYYIILIYTK